jgi:hypothetical protein
LLQLLVSLCCLDWSRSIEFAMLQELDSYWALQHKFDSPSFRSMYQEEHIIFGAEAVSWLGCYTDWCRYLTRFALELHNFLCNGQNYPDHWAIEINLNDYII